MAGVAWEALWVMASDPELQLPQTPILCDKKFCNCGQDIMATKVKSIRSAALSSHNQLSKQNLTLSPRNNFFHSYYQGVSYVKL